MRNGSRLHKTPAKCRSSKVMATVQALRLAGIGLALAAGLMIAGHSQAIEYRSVAESAILYDSPSDKGKKLFIVAPGTPVEVIVSLDKWIKVRDPAGAITWIGRSALANRRTVLVTVPRVVVRRQPSESAVPAFEAVKDVVLELVETPANGWIKVRHADGASGHVRISEVWGL